MQTVEIKQDDNRLLIVGGNHIGYQYSANLKIKIKLQVSESPFDGLVKKVVATVPGDKSSYYCATQWHDDYGLIALPEQIYEKDGEIALSMAGISDDGIVITTNLVRLHVDESNSLITVSPPPTKLWEQEVMELMTQFVKDNVDPKFDELTKKALDQQTALDQRIEAFDDKVSDIDTMLADGDFDGSTIISGLVAPAKDAGKDNDYYLNTQTGDYYQKIDDAWTLKLNVLGPTSIALDNEILNSVAFKSVRNPDAEKILVQVQATDGKALMFETSDDNVFLEDGTSLKDYLKTCIKFISDNDDGSITVEYDGK